MRDLDMFGLGGSQLYSRIAAEDSCETDSTRVITSDFFIERIRLGELPLTSDVILTPYLAPATGAFPNDVITDLQDTSYNDRPYFYIGDKKILVFMFVTDTIGASEKYNFTPVLYYNNQPSAILSVAQQINLLFTQAEDDHGYTYYKNGSTLYVSPLFTRLVGAAKYVRIFGRMYMGNWDLGINNWYYYQFSTFPNLQNAKIYLGAI